jgi:hypothetical protein
MKQHARTKESRIKMQFFQSLIEALVRPDVVREFPGWGPLYGRFVGS